VFQQKSSAKERVRGAGRVAMLAFGSSGMIVITQAAGTLDLFSTIDRTWPVIVEPADRVVAVLPLNWAIRKRRTSFGSLVANVKMRVLLGPRTIAIQRYLSVKIVNRSSTASRAARGAIQPVI
jgi:hypothetical protein